MLEGFQNVVRVETRRRNFRWMQVQITCRPNIPTKVNPPPGRAGSDYDNAKMNLERMNPKANSRVNIQYYPKCTMMITQISWWQDRNDQSPIRVSELEEHVAGAIFHWVLGEGVECLQVASQFGLQITVRKFNRKRPGYITWMLHLSFSTGPIQSHPFER